MQILNIKLPFVLYAREARNRKVVQFNTWLKNWCTGRASYESSDFLLGQVGLVQEEQVASELEGKNYLHKEVHKCYSGSSVENRTTGQQVEGPIASF